MSKYNRPELTNQRRAKTQRLEQTRLELGSAHDAPATKSAWSLTKVKASSDEALK